MFDDVLYNLCPWLTPSVAASRLLATLAWLKLKGVAGNWLVQHTAPARAKPDSRTHLEGVYYRYPTSSSLPTYPSSTVHVTHTLAHTYQFPSSPCDSALDHYEVSALSSIVGWTSAQNNERTNKWLLFAECFNCYCCSKEVRRQTVSSADCCAACDIWFVLLQEEQRLRAKQAKEDLEDFLLTTEKINSTIKYR